MDAYDVYKRHLRDPASTQGHAAVLRSIEDPSKKYHCVFAGDVGERQSRAWWEANVKSTVLCRGTLAYPLGTVELEHWVRAVQPYLLLYIYTTRGDYLTPREGRIQGTRILSMAMYPSDLVDLASKRLARDADDNVARKAFKMARELNHRPILRLLYKYRISIHDLIGHRRPWVHDIAWPLRRHPPFLPTEGGRFYVPYSLSLPHEDKEAIRVVVVRLVPGWTLWVGRADVMGKIRLGHPTSRPDVRVLVRDARAVAELDKVHPTHSFHGMPPDQRLVRRLDTEVLFFLSETVQPLPMAGLPSAALALLPLRECSRESVRDVVCKAAGSDSEERFRLVTIGQVTCHLSPILIVAAMMRSLLPQQDPDVLVVVEVSDSSPSGIERDLRSVLPTCAGVRCIRPWEVWGIKTIQSDPVQGRWLVLWENRDGIGMTIKDVSPAYGDHARTTHMVFKPHDVDVERLVRQEAGLFLSRLAGVVLCGGLAPRADTVFQELASVVSLPEPRHRHVETEMDPSVVAARGIGTREEVIIFRVMEKDANSTTILYEGDEMDVSSSLVHVLVEVLRQRILTDDADGVIRWDSDGVLEVDRVYELYVKVDVSKPLSFVLQKDRLVVQGRVLALECPWTWDPDVVRSCWRRRLEYAGGDLPATVAERIRAVCRPRPCVTPRGMHEHATRLFMNGASPRLVDQFLTR